MDVESYSTLLLRGGSQRFKLFGLITAWGCKGGWVEGPHPLGGHNFAPCGAIKTNFVRPGPDLRCGCAESAEYNAWLGAGSERCRRVREELSFNFSRRTGNKKNFKKTHKKTHKKSHKKSHKKNNPSWDWWLAFMVFMSKVCEVVAVGVGGLRSYNLMWL